MITFTIYKNIEVIKNDSNLLKFYIEYNSISRILPYIESEAVNDIIINDYKIFKKDNIIKIEKTQN
jgi:hypothetical protein